MAHTTRGPAFVVQTEAGPSRITYGGDMPHLGLDDLYRFAVPSDPALRPDGGADGRRVGGDAAT